MNVSNVIPLKWFKWKLREKKVKNKDSFYVIDMRIYVFEYFFHQSIIFFLTFSVSNVSKQVYIYTCWWWKHFRAIHWDFVCTRSLDGVRWKYGFIFLFLFLFYIIWHNNCKLMFHIQPNHRKCSYFLCILCWHELNINK